MKLLYPVSGQRSRWVLRALCSAGGRPCAATKRWRMKQAQTNELLCEHTQDVSRDACDAWIHRLRALGLRTLVPFCSSACFPLLLSSAGLLGLLWADAIVVDATFAVGTYRGCLMLVLSVSASNQSKCLVQFQRGKIYQVL